MQTIKRQNGKLERADDAENFDEDDDDDDGQPAVGIVITFPDQHRLPK